ncbi:MAG TPA: sigma-70 family RNA polymerase sigma factor, partial [Ramlibacter sp.]
RIVRDQGAEDVLAEVYIQVWRSLASYDALRGEPAAWLSTIARSRALDHLRRERRHGDTLPPTPEDAIADDGDGPEQLLWRAQQGRMVRESLALAPLSERERLVLKLAYYSDQTHQEIAQQTGLPLGTVKTLIHRAQKKLGAQVLAPAGATGLRGAAAAGDTIAP